MASLIAAVRKLMKDVGLPATIAATKTVDRATFLAEAPQLAERAYEDQCTTANCKQPKVTDLQAILNKAYDGK